MRANASKKEGEREGEGGRGERRGREGGRRNLCGMVVQESDLCQILVGISMGTSLRQDSPSFP